MISQDLHKTNTSPSLADGGIYFRLIALWVFCEAMLGGIIHGFKIPVSGLVVGSSAVICICLIGWYAPARGAILKATLIVAVFKMMLSPQAPPTAYIAVFFQGLLGELLLRNKKYYRAACLSLAILALLESAMQRILVLTIIYGNDFWQVLNDSIYSFGGQAGTDYSFFLITWYVLVHLIAGVLVGVWAGILPQRIALLNRLQEQYPVPAAATPPLRALQTKKRNTARIFFFIIWIVLLVLYLQSVLDPPQALLPTHVSLRILARSFIIILSWYFFIGPLLRKFLQRWLQQKQRQSARQVEQVMGQLPWIQHLVLQSWRLAAHKSGLKRVRLCCRIILANTFHNVRT